MIAAGQTNNQTAGAMPSIGWNNIQTPAFGTGTNTVYQLSGDYAKQAHQQQMQRQEKLDTWNMYLQAGQSVVNAAGQITSMALNYSLQKRYFNLQESIADKQFRLGNRGMDLEFEKLEVSQRMNREGMDHQRRLANIQKQTAVTIASIQEKGKTKRAEIFATMNAFKRTNYQYGTPTFQTGVMS